MNRLFYLSLTCLLLSACETVIEVDIPREAPKLVANALINPDSLVAVRLSQSKFVLDNNPLQTVDGAVVKIFENGQLKETLQGLGDGLYQSQFKPAENSEYTLQVEAPGFDPVEATTFIQPKVHIQDLQYDSLSVQSGTHCTPDSCWDIYSNTYRFRLTFKDPGASANFYEVSGYANAADTIYLYDESWNIIGIDTIFYSTWPLYFYTEDPVVTNLEFEFEGEGYEGPTLLFTDEIFSGKEYTLSFDQLGYFGSNLTEVALQFKTMDEAHYRYLRSKTLQNDNEGNPFAEPVPVYSNVDQGFGIFAGYSADTYRLSLH